MIYIIIFYHTLTLVVPFPCEPELWCMLLWPSPSGELRPSSFSPHPYRPIAYFIQRVYVGPVTTSLAAIGVCF